MWFILLFMLWFPHLLCVNILKQVHLSYVQSKYWHWIFAPETGMFRFASAFNRSMKLLLVVVMHFVAKLPIQNRFWPLENMNISSNWLKQAWFKLNMLECVQHILANIHFMFQLSISVNWCYQIDFHKALIAHYHLKSMDTKGAISSKYLLFIWQQWHLNLKMKWYAYIATGDKSDIHE